jgi:hypothetical protein
MGAAANLIRQTFAAALFHLGEAEACRLWAVAAKKPRGGRKGSRKPDKDEVLLRFYDEMIRLCGRNP